MILQVAGRLWSFLDLTKDEASLKVSEACVELARNQPDVAVQLAKEAQVPWFFMLFLRVWRHWFGYER